jgi:hypothetical protein
MSLERATEESAAVRAARRVRGRLVTAFAPVTRQLAAADRRLVRVVRGSWLHAWLTADPDPDPIVIDLRETYTVGPLLAALDWVAPVVARSRLVGATEDVATRVEAAPVRAAGLLVFTAFAASLLATIAAGPLTLPLYLFHAVGVVAGAAMLRENRDADALSESPFWSAVAAGFAPPPEPDDRDREQGGEHQHDHEG